MALSTSKIIRIVSGGNLDSTSTKVHIDEVSISNDDHFAVFDEGVLKLLSNKLFITRILRVHGNSNITKHGFKTRRSNDDLLVSAFDLVGEFGQLSKSVPFFSVAGNLELGGLGQVDIFDLKI